MDKPTIRRVTTGHDAAGRAVFLADERFAPVPHPLGTADLTQIWSSSTVPADNGQAFGGGDREGPSTRNPLKQGASIRIVDLPPGYDGPMHRTSTVDFIMVLSGQLELELDDGAITLLAATDTVIQRGTVHRWGNPSATEPCRMLVTLIEARPYVHDGQPLGDVHT